jgi:hypothetical protein
VIELLTERTEEQPWWLGYLDTGASDVVFPYAPRATVYCGYGYVLVEAGPQQAASWRDTSFNWALPDLMFPADRSWLVSTMWDDGWTSIGASEHLVSGFSCAIPSSGRERGAWLLDRIRTNQPLTTDFIPGRSVAVGGLRFDKRGWTGPLAALSLKANRGSREPTDDSAAATNLQASRARPLAPVRLLLSTKGAV